MGDFLRLLCVFALVLNVSCLFEDQVGTYDWRQQYVGKPSFSHIDFSSKKFYVATENNVLSALSIKSGNIAWRKIFESNEIGHIDFVLWGSSEILVITGNGRRVQSFDYSNGFANWEYTLFNRWELMDKKFAGLESKRQSGRFYVTDGKQICLLSLKERTCIDLPSDGGYVYETLFETSKGVNAIGYKESSAQNILFSSSLSSIVSKKSSVISSGARCFKFSDSDLLVSFSSQDKKITRQTSENEFSFQELPILGKNLESYGLDAKLVYASKNKFILEAKGDLMTFKLNGESLVMEQTINAVENYQIKTLNGEFYLVFSMYSNQLNELSFNVMCLTKEKPEHVVKVSSDEKNEQYAILQFDTAIVETKTGQFGLLTLCFFEDYSMVMFNTQGTRYFTREEALSYISAVEMIDFPLSHLQEEFEDEFGNAEDENPVAMFVKRIRTQTLQLKEFVTIELYNKVVNLINSNSPQHKRSSKSQVLSAEDISRDEFNLNKIIVVATTVGKVYGIYSSADGQILWSFYLKNTSPFVLNDNKPSVSLFLQRTSAHFPHEPQASFVSKSASGSQTRVFFFNPLTGQAIKNSPKDGLTLDFKTKQAFIYPTVDSEFLKPLMIFDQENKLHVLPEKSNELLKESSRLNVIYSVNTDNGKDTILTGYAMSSGNEASPELWRVIIEDEMAEAIGAKHPNDRIHSHGKVLGDRSVLYKYLNPNLIGVVTTGYDGQKQPFVNVYLIDTVTGAIVNSFNHKRCNGPVNIVHSENWFFYSYYNLKSRRYEVTSLELFEGSRQFNSTSFSSFDDVKPIFYTKSYVVQKAFSSMQVTLTEKGITTKDVIVACQSGVIIDIPWILVDPRRPMKMTEVEKEENLLPYMPEIPLNYAFSLNYYNYVYNVRGIATSSTGLESTSLVFAYGLDIYFTRVFPSKTFDLLREDFDYLFVSTLMFGLLTGTFLTKKLASSSNLKKAWK